MHGMASGALEAHADRAIASSAVGRMPGLWWLAGVALLFTGCISGSPAEAPRLYAPVMIDVTAGTPRETATDEAPRRLRLARVAQAEYLEKRMVWRSSDVELGYRELERWSQSPAAYLEERLSQVLFRDGGLRRSLSGDAPELRVTLEAFDELLGPPHEALLRVSVLLVDPGGAILLDRLLEVREPIAGPGGAAFARAMASALLTLGARLGSAVAEALGG